MLCFAALIVLGILSIFSAKYRDLTGEAFDCVFRRVTLRPCTTGFNVKVKSSILSSLLTKAPRVAQFFGKYYEQISFVFVILFFASLVWSARGVYNFWAFGDCNGLNQGGFCAFDPTGANNQVSGSSETCRAGGAATGDLTLTNVNLDAFPLIPGQPGKELVFIGCYACKYTKETYPLIKQIMATYKPAVRFVFYPTHGEAEYLKPYDYCVRKTAPEKYMEWADALYGAPHDAVADEAFADKLLNQLGIKDKVMQCMADPSTKVAVQKETYEIDKTGIYGTPTVFVNETPIVGPKPFRVYRRLLNGSLF